MEMLVAAEARNVRARAPARREWGRSVGEREARAVEGRKERGQKPDVGAAEDDQPGEGRDYGSGEGLRSGGD